MKIINTYILIIICLCGCAGSTTYILNDTPAFSSIMQSEYKLKENCFIAEPVRYSIKYPYIIPYGRIAQPLPKNINPSGTICQSLPVETQYIGKTYDEFTILGIAPKGTILKIKEIRGRSTFEDYYFECDVETDLKGFQVLTGDRLLDGYHRPNPRLFPEHTEKIIK